VTTAAYSEVLRDLEAFLSLCRARGLKQEVAASRFSLYRIRIQDLSVEIGRLRAGEPAAPIYKRLAADLPKHLVALFESLEVGGMMPFMNACPAEVLKPRLKLLLSGPEMPSDEDQASNQARNIQFELWLANTLSRAGASVVLAEPDLRCTIRDITILVACKRLVSVRKLTKRINEATEQLGRGLRALPGQALSGVIAISLTRVLPTNDRSETIANQAEGMERLASRIELLVERRAKWRQSREAQAILFQIASTFTNLEVDRIQCGYFLTMYGDGPVAAALNERLQPLAG
jgi:hypothetical protein